MLRSTRPLLGASARGLLKPRVPIAPLGVSQTRRSASSTTWRAGLPTVAPSKQLTPWTQRASYATKNERDADFEKEIAKKKLESDPEHVTHESSVRQFEPPTRPASGTDSAGLKGDLVWLSPHPRYTAHGCTVVLTINVTASRSRGPRARERASSILQAGPGGHHPLSRDVSRYVLL